MADPVTTTLAIVGFQAYEANKNRKAIEKESQRQVEAQNRNEEERKKKEFESEKRRIERTRAGFLASQGKNTRRGGTILTSPLGLTGGGQTQAKTLLGT